MSSDEILAEITRLRDAIKSSVTSAEASPHRKQIMKLREEYELLTGKGIEHSYLSNQERNKKLYCEKLATDKAEGKRTYTKEEKAAYQLAKKVARKAAYEERQANSLVDSNPEKGVVQNPDKERAELNRLVEATRTSKTQVEAQFYRDIIRDKKNKLDERIKVREAEIKTLTTELRAFNAEQKLRHKTFNPFTGHLKDTDKSAIYNSSLDSMKRISVLLFERNLFTHPIITVEFDKKSYFLFSLTSKQLTFAERWLTLSQEVLLPNSIGVAK